MSDKETVEAFQEKELSGAGKGTPLKGVDPMEIAKGVNVRLQARIGEADIPFSQLMQLKGGDVVELAASVSDLVDILLDEELVARGELVVAGDNLGVRITQVAEFKN